MIRLLTAALAASAPLFAFAAPEMPARPALPPPAAPTAFRAPGLASSMTVALPAATEKELAAGPETPQGPVRVAAVRSVEKAAPIVAWTRVREGYVARIGASSAGSLGLRVRLDLSSLESPLEVRVAGADGRIESRLVASDADQAWTPWTDGAAQSIELFSAARPGLEAVRVGAILHFMASPLDLKAAGLCTLEVMCAATDASLGAGVADAIAERARSIMRLQFVSGSSGFVCTGTLINTEKFPAPYVLTANHCVDNDVTADSITSLWMFQSDLNCPSAGTPPQQQQLAGGSQLVFTNYNLDSTLLLLNQAPPENASYSAWSARRIANGESVVSLSHPEGDTARYAIGNAGAELGIVNWPEPMYGVRFASGIIQGGSSGSGLFTMSGSSLQLRAILTGTTIAHSPEGMSCTDTNEQALYTRFDVFEPEIEPFIRRAGIAADDAPNRPQDLFNAAADPTRAENLNEHTATRALDARRIDYPGDVDVYRFVLNSPSWVSTWTEGPNIDTVGNILDSRGVSKAFNDDAGASNNHFGITKQLDPGIYYVQVQHFEPAGTGAYNLRMRADVLDTNFTDIWWNPAESGWGINFNHQDNILFGTLFTYDASGAPMWLVLSNGARQADGSYAGDLFRATGSPFNATPFTGATLAKVGAMRVAFSSASDATLTYTFNGASVTKTITRQQFSTPPSCGWSAFDRSFAHNFQDLWWNPAESGWGVNIAHQGNTLFATLFTYDATGKGMWLLMSNGGKTGTNRWSGTLYSTTGPAFNASPWTAISLTPVGTMSFAFADGNNGTMTYSVNGTTVTKSIQRQVFGQMKAECE